MRTTKTLQSATNGSGPHDFLGAEAHLSGEEKRVRAEVRSCVEERIQTNIKGWWEKVIFPRQLAPEMGKLGPGGMHHKGPFACLNEARMLLGGNGVTLGYSPLRHANNLESVLTYEGTGEVHTLVLGNAIFGIPAFK